MSILKSTHSGKELYWAKVLEQRHYILEAYRGNANEYYFHACFKYPFTKQVGDCFFITETNDLIAYITTGTLQSYFVRIQDIKQMELCEWYWEAKHNSIFGEKSKEKTNELANAIINYEHS